ncbi:DUF975 family protein [Bacillus cereus group sp. BfR-BA-01380]|uniref:DUF975 family protein n=1 Tax=Bacillus cereus group sp. BfR-BA-01380 TaxID=2920324 RepID=UPI001F5A65BA|nr:DUF975 family protein [Bacillus cereus group sp. BfR-BA-01380]
MISDLKKAALSSLKDRWGLGAGATFLYYAIPSAVTSIIGGPMFLLWSVWITMMGPSAFVDYSVTGEEEINVIVFFSALAAYVLICAIMFIGSIAVQGIMMYGYFNITLRFAKQESTTIDGLFEGFRKKNVFRSIKLTLLMTVYILLWSLLLVVPGIIKSFSYSMAYYILLEHPEYTASEALKKSQEMMKGHKLDLFILGLSFIGWFILGVFTFGIAYLWIYPYYTTTVSHFYLNLVNKDKVAEEKPVI